MEFLKYRTRENDLGDRLKVYFACHPDDFNQTFDKICEDIFKTHDCCICYVEDGSAEALREKPDEFLTDMNLFVIPVTSRLLSEKDPAVDVALSYARRERKPVLPILMEEDVAEVYSQDERFRDLHYIDSCVQDASGLGYEDRLYWHLNIFLDGLTVCDSIYGKAGNEEPAERIIRAAEKGNAGAMENCEMMYWYRIGVPQDWQKAIEWGEKCVDRTIEVMGEEHPAVRWEMKTLIRFCGMAGATGKALRLERKLDMILCRTIISEEDLSTRAETTMEIEEGERWYDYFLRNTYGSRHWALREMKWLVHLYGITGDYEKAIELGKHHGASSCSNVESPYLIIVQGWLVYFYRETGNCEKGIELGEWVLKILCRSFGEEDPFTLQVMYDLAFLYEDMKNYGKSIEFWEKLCEIRSRVRGEEDPHTLLVMNNLLRSYLSSYNYEKGIKLGEKLYEIQSRLCGEEAKDTLREMKFLVYFYGDAGNYDKAIELGERVYEIWSRTLGEEEASLQPMTKGLVFLYAHSGRYEKAIELGEKIYEIQSRTLGEEDPKTLDMLGNLAVCNIDSGNYEKGRELARKLYEIHGRILGEEDQQTLRALVVLADAYDRLGDHEKALELCKRVTAADAELTEGAKKRIERIMLNT